MDIQSRIQCWLLIAHESLTAVTVPTLQTSSGAFKLLSDRLFSGFLPLLSDSDVTLNALTIAVLFDASKRRFGFESDRGSALMLRFALSD
ncbi:MAG: hypothetical protein KME27_12930 [Lyngbya sp. HA4199-MV5]|jgi:hypothetical protein|nr:hypothetical protein [Lyngbya sp. HA4199-MV5]